MLKETIRQKMITSLKAGRIMEKSTYSSILSAVKNKEIELKRETTDDEVIQIVQKEIKQLNETMSMAAGRNDIIMECNLKIKFLKEFAPSQLSEDEVFEQVCISLKDIQNLNKGLAMRICMTNLKGKADNKFISDSVDKYLKGDYE